MNEILLLSGAILVVMMVVFLSARRFGMISLALAAGAVIVGLWTERLAVVMKEFDIGALGVPTGVLVSVFLLLAPLGLVSLVGPKYRGLAARTLSAFGAGLLVVAFLIGLVGNSLAIYNYLLKNHDWLNGAWQYVATIGLAVGLFDILSQYLGRQGK